jgi:cephalosporin hydroxylase
MKKQINQKKIIDQFHKLYFKFHQSTWKNTYWLEVNVFKSPFDLWVYQEIICEIKPDLIIESGTAKGGSALFMASICDFINNGEIISIDIINNSMVKHKRIKHLIGSSISNKIVSQIKRIAKDKKNIMVILDSDHKMSHVLKEMIIYQEFISKNGYLIVEDTCVNGNPICPNYGQGPMEAVKKFLKCNDNFVVDHTREKFLMTFNPKGFLKRIN